jgi:hypothetical protein
VAARASGIFLDFCDEVDFSFQKSRSRADPIGENAQECACWRRIGLELLEFHAWVFAEVTNCSKFSLRILNSRLQVGDLGGVGIAAGNSATTRFWRQNCLPRDRRAPEVGTDDGRSLVCTYLSC